MNIAVTVAGIFVSDTAAVFSDGNIPEGDTLSPTDIEANLSTEVALTVLDVLGLFVHHHKVCGPPAVSNLKLHPTPNTYTSHLSSAF